MKLANATNLNRKFGVVEWRDLLFLLQQPKLGAPFKPYFGLSGIPSARRAHLFVVRSRGRGTCGALSASQ
jgi:hypothetical protein